LTRARKRLVIRAVHVSIVIPLYNEEDNVDPLVRELAAIQPALGQAEVLLVDDGSRDGTWARIAAASRIHPFIRGVRCTQNRGQSSAMLAGLRRARGEVMVTLDGDLQNNPADIPELVKRVGAFDVVCGYRAKRRDTWSRRVASRIGNGIRNWVTADGLRDTGCSLKAFHRRCVPDLPPVNGVHRFMGAYFRTHGRTIEQIPVDHRPRTAGVSKYTNLKRLPKTAFDLVGFAWYRSRLLREPPIEETPAA
jgi:dolichol-phosphate mannosyltransferase